MNASEHAQKLRARADQLAAVLVMLGHRPHRVADPEEDCQRQQALLLAAAAGPYVETAADPASCGQPWIFAESVQGVQGHAADPHAPVHQHLITHLGLAAQYLQALFGPLSGAERPDTLRALHSFSLALLATAGETQERVLSSRVVGTRGENNRARSVNYVLDAAELSRLAGQAAWAAREFITHLEQVAPDREDLSE